MGNYLDTLLPRLLGFVFTPYYFGRVLHNYVLFGPLLFSFEEVVMQELH